MTRCSEITTIINSKSWNCHKKRRKRGAIHDDSLQIPNLDSAIKYYYQFTISVSYQPNENSLYEIFIIADHVDSLFLVFLRWLSWLTLLAMSFAFTSYPIFRHSPLLASIHDLPGVGNEGGHGDTSSWLMQCSFYVFFSLYSSIFSWQYEVSQPPATFLVILIIEFEKFCLKPMRHVII